MPGQWAGSTRHDQLPTNWATIAAAIHARSGGLCEVTRASTGQRCGRPADGGVDHITRPADGGTDEPPNLQDTCRWHHNRKSSAEGNKARALTAKKLKHPRERNPGLISPHD